MDVQRCSLIASTLFHSGSPKVRIPTAFGVLAFKALMCDAVDTDILKPDTGSVPFERVSAPHSRLASTEGSSGHQTPDRRNSDHRYTEPVSEGEEDEEMDVGPAKDERKLTGISGQELDEAIAFREKMLKERQVIHDDGSGGEGGPSERTPFLKNRNTYLSASVKPRALSIDPLAPSQAFDKTLRERLGQELNPGTAAPKNQSDRPSTGHADDDEVEAALASDERIVSRDFRAPKGKRIAVPVRIEPKVYFASERTFLVCFPNAESDGQSINRPLEMASLLNLHRNDCHRPPQLHRARRHTWSNCRRIVHLRSSGYHCVLRRCLCSQRV